MKNLTLRTILPFRAIHISIEAQRLELRGEDGAVLFSARCSSGAAGTGCEPGSGRTPLGRFAVHSKHGENAPLNTIFRARLPVGTYSAATGGEDPILARILTLRGLEPHNANTLSRYIYIHGTSDTARLGTPVSHGCIRLSPQDAATLFDLVPLNTQVWIKA